MSKIFLTVLLVLMTFQDIVRAQLSGAGGEAVLAAGSGDDYWVTIVGTTATSPQTTSFVSSVRRRTDAVVGRWEEIARLQARVIDTAAFRGGLAVLVETGDWKLLQPGGSAVDGHALPHPYRPIHFASDADTLLAIAGIAPVSTTTTTAPATMPSKPALYRWDRNAWSRVTDLPDSADATNASVIASSGNIFLAYRLRDAIQVDRLVSGAWQGFSSLPLAAAFKLIPNSPIPLLATADEKGQWAVTDLLAQTPPRQLASHTPSDLVMVGPTLRLVYPGQNTSLEQISYNDYGRGNVFGPDSIGQMALPQQLSHAPLQLVILLVLSTLALLTFRKRPVALPGLQAVSGLELAPIPRRVAAGLLDAAPLLAALAYAIPRFEALSGAVTPADIGALAKPLLGGFAVYLIHTTICEMIWGKTIGKFLFGLRISSYDGSPVPRERAFLRNLLRVVDVGMCVPWLMLAMTPMQQRLGDIAARTIVVIDKKP